MKRHFAWVLRVPPAADTDQKWHRPDEPLGKEDGHHRCQRAGMLGSVEPEKKSLVE